MQKKTLIIYISSAIIVILGVFFLFRPKTASHPISDGATILFTRFDCPHCLNVENYIAENSLMEKKGWLEQKEIHNADNAVLFLEKTKKCGLSEDQIGVPLLVEGDKCYSGDQDIIDYFRGLNINKL